jgi:hypothetical protein
VATAAVYIAVLVAVCIAVLAMNLVVVGRGNRRNRHVCRVVVSVFRWLQGAAE